MGSSGGDHCDAGLGRPVFFGEHLGETLLGNIRGTL